MAYEQLETPLDLINLERTNTNFQQISADIASAESASLQRDSSLETDYNQKLNAQKTEYINRLNVQDEKIDNFVGDVSEQVFNEIVDSAKLIWLAPVDDFASLSTQYPSPIEGNASMVRDTGKVYRFDGTQWLEIQDIDPTAINEVDSRLTTKTEEVKKIVSDIPFQSGLFEKIPEDQKKVGFPDDFSWTSAPIEIFKSDKGAVSTTFDAANHKPNITGTQTYYISLTGSNSNDGLSESTPFRRVSDALVKPDCGRIIISGGLYPRGQAWAGFSPARNMIIQAKSGEEVILSAHDDLTWTLASGTTKVYQASRSTVNDVFDAKFVNKYGDYAELKNVTSVAECESTQGSWFTNGSIIYVHTFNSRPADGYIRAYLNTNNAIITSGNHFYIEGIRFEGGNSNLRVDGTDSNMKIAMKNCKFKYTKLLNCVTILGAEVYAQNCEASYANQDGFNYHIKGSTVCKVIEVNCRSHRNGRDGADQNNGSTNHDGGKTIRVNGEYFENHGPNVIDVNEGSESWNIGVTAHQSTASSGISNADFKNSNIGKGLMWLDSCISYNSDYSVVTAGSLSATYLNNNILNAPTSNDANTTLAQFPTTYIPVSEYTEVI